MGIRDPAHVVRSPWQNGYVERLIGSTCRTNSPAKRAAEIDASSSVLVVLVVPIEFAIAMIVDLDGFLFDLLGR
jgi:hypothetical protein